MAEKTRAKATLLSEIEKGNAMDVAMQFIEHKRRQKLLEHQRAYMREYRAGKRRRDKK